MFVLALLLAPLFLGVVNRVKAYFAGRNGPRLLQKYYDLAKLSRKDVVYSTTVGWTFRACPVVVAAAALAAAILTPFGRGGAVFSFAGDFLFWTGAFTLARVFMVLAALDTGSSFEGMGASREIWYSALTEPALFLSLATLAEISGDLSMGGFFLALTPMVTGRYFIALVFTSLALGVVAVAENARIPVDDPNTHLELTMIHEAMILDHSGPDLALIEYGSALKLWLMASLAVGALVPVNLDSQVLDTLCFLGGMFVFALLLGTLESVMARLKLVRVPQLLVGASVLAALSLILVARS